ncbi:hypothetical protein PPGU19_070690 (plasmid) [Paraburkholderia sp. PGU19]|nr:hypothetical protein PPGU19_070690 [Paraburkholderia sp. PGU19]
MMEHACSYRVVRWQSCCTNFCFAWAARRASFANGYERAVPDKLGAIVVPQSFALGLAHEAFDENGQPLDRMVAKLVSDVGAALYKVSARLS